MKRFKRWLQGKMAALMACILIGTATLAVPAGDAEAAGTPPSVLATAFIFGFSEPGCNAGFVGADGAAVFGLTWILSRAVERSNTHLIRLMSDRYPSWRSFRWMWRCYNIN